MINAGGKRTCVGLGPPPDAAGWKATGRCVPQNTVRLAVCGFQHAALAKQGASSRVRVARPAPRRPQHGRPIAAAARRRCEGCVRTWPRGIVRTSPGFEKTRLAPAAARPRCPAARPGTAATTRCPQGRFPVSARVVAAARASEPPPPRASWRRWASQPPTGRGPPPAAVRRVATRPQVYEHTDGRGARGGACGGPRQGRRRRRRGGRPLARASPRPLGAGRDGVGTRDSAPLRAHIAPSSPFPEAGSSWARKEATRPEYLDTASCRRPKSTVSASRASTRLVSRIVHMGRARWRRIAARSHLGAPLQARGPLPCLSPLAGEGCAASGATRDGE